MVRHHQNGSGRNWHRVNMRELDKMLNSSIFSQLLPSSLSWTTFTALEPHDDRWPLHHANDRKESETHSMKKKSLIQILFSIIFGPNSFCKIMSVYKTVGKPLKVLRHVLKISHITNRAIIIVQANQCLSIIMSIISVIQTQMRKTTVDQVVEGLKFECSGDSSIAAEMSNQTLLWVSTADQAQCNQAQPSLRVTFSFSSLQFLTRVFCLHIYWKAATHQAIWIALTII